MARYRSAARTDVGMKREHNEDSFLVNDDLGLFVVCDGMGGHAGGETASRLAVQTIEKELISAQLRNDDPVLVRGRARGVPARGRAARGGGGRLLRGLPHQPRQSRAGGHGHHLHLAARPRRPRLLGHVGDSRAYLVRDGEVRQLSEDHSLVNEQVRAGLLTQEEAKHSRLKNIITRSVGFEEDVLVDVMGVETRAGDRFLLCSDGLSNLVEDARDRRAMSHDDVAQVPEMLIELANARGGDDNITVVAVHRTE